MCVYWEYAVLFRILLEVCVCMWIVKMSMARKKILWERTRARTRKHIERFLLCSHIKIIDEQYCLVIKSIFNASKLLSKWIGLRIILCGSTQCAGGMDVVCEYYGCVLSSLPLCHRCRRHRWFCDFKILLPPVYTRAPMLKYTAIVHCPHHFCAYSRSHRSIRNANIMGKINKTLWSEMYGVCAFWKHHS